jgi:hypothetical protein
LRSIMVMSALPLIPRRMRSIRPDAVRDAFSREREKGE